MICRLHEIRVDGHPYDIPSAANLENIEQIRCKAVTQGGKNHKKGKDQGALWDKTFTYAAKSISIFLD
jgi:hypothetical protein